MIKATSKFSGLDYYQVLRLIDAEIIPLRMVSRITAKGASPSIRYLTIRHDVDYDIDQAVNLAEVEADHGITSTYFLLHTAPYFDYSKEFADKVKVIQSLGHDIGIHNNFLTELFSQNGNRKPLVEIIARPIQFIRDLGVDVLGTSSHGDPKCYTYGYLNYQCWTECPKDYALKGIQTCPPFPKITMKAFGLEYETYFLHRDAYLTDTGGKWQGFVKPKEVYPFERSLPMRDLLEATTTFNLQPAGIMQALFHPIWWEFAEI